MHQKRPFDTSKDPQKCPFGTFRYLQKCPFDRSKTLKNALLLHSDALKNALLIRAETLKNAIKKAVIYAQSESKKKESEGTLLVYFILARVGYIRQQCTLIEMRFVLECGSRPFCY